MKEEKPCSVCRIMFWPIGDQATCEDCSKDAELTKLKADVARLRAIIRHLLLSADAVWYEKNEGHDWRVAVDDAARALEETK